MNWPVFFGTIFGVPLGAGALIGCFYLVDKFVTKYPFAAQLIVPALWLVGIAAFVGIMVGK